MTYEIDSLGRVWLNNGVIIPDCGRAWDDYQTWLDEGNTPTPRTEGNE